MDVSFIQTQYIPTFSDASVVDIFSTATAKDKKQGYCNIVYMWVREVKA